MKELTLACFVLVLIFLISSVTFGQTFGMKFVGTHILIPEETEKGSIVNLTVDVPSQNYNSTTTKTLDLIQLVDEPVQIQTRSVKPLEEIVQGPFSFPGVRTNAVGTKGEIIMFHQPGSLEKMKFKRDVLPILLREGYSVEYKVTNLPTQWSLREGQFFWRVFNRLRPNTIKNWIEERKAKRAFNMIEQSPLLRRKAVLLEDCKV